MRTYFAGIISKIKQHSEKLDNLTLLTDNHWVVLDELTNSKYVYIFRSNNELLVAQNGKVVKGKWEYLGNNSLLIEQDNGSYLFKHGFFDSSILALKVDGKDEFAFLINENQYEGELNSIDKVLSFLDTKYLKMISTKINTSTTKRVGPVRKTIAVTAETLAIPNEEDVDLQPIEHKKKNIYGYQNGEGELKIQHQYHGAYKFKEGRALVYTTKRNVDYYGYINPDGDQLIQMRYEYGEDFSEGLALVRLNRKFGFIDKSGEVVIDFHFDDADSFKKGKARVKMRDQEFYIDKLGNQAY